MIYSEKDRQVFGPYFDGQQSRYGDPLAINRRLTAALGGDQSAIAKYHADPQAQEAVLRAARIALELVPFDPATGSGALDIDAETALRSFLEFLEGNGSRAGKSPTSSLPILDSLPSYTPPASLTWDMSASS